MYAVVKNIGVGTVASSGGKMDVFVHKMIDNIGKKMRFKKSPEKNWYKNVVGDCYSYHTSWLKIEKKKAK